MMLNVYATRNKKSGQFGKPVFELMSCEQLKESYTCSFLEAPENDKILMRELEAYQVGNYDSATGRLIPCDPVFLIDLGSIDGKTKEEK